MNSNMKKSSEFNKIIITNPNGENLSSKSEDFENLQDFLPDFIINDINEKEDNFKNKNQFENFFFENEDEDCDTDLNFEKLSLELNTQKSSILEKIKKTEFQENFSNLMNKNFTSFHFQKNQLQNNMNYNLSKSYDNHINKERSHPQHQFTDKIFNSSSEIYYNCSNPQIFLNNSSNSRNSQYQNNFINRSFENFKNIKPNYEFNQCLINNEFQNKCNNVLINQRIIEKNYSESSNFFDGISNGNEYPSQYQSHFIINQNKKSKDDFYKYNRIPHQDNNFIFNNFNPQKNFPVNNNLNFSNFSANSSFDSNKNYSSMRSVPNSPVSKINYDFYNEIKNKTVDENDFLQGKKLNINNRIKENNSFDNYINKNQKFTKDKANFQNRNYNKCIDKNKKTSKQSLFVKERKKEFQETNSNLSIKIENGIVDQIDEEGEKFEINDKIQNEKSTKNDIIKHLNALNCDFAVYICSQKGSRVLQKFLDKINPDTLNILIENLSKKFPDLMMDTYGNYFCQKLIQCCSAEQRIKILKFISTDLVKISYNTSGTHALQSLLELINQKEEELIFIENLKNDCLNMCYDKNATHVIQKILNCISENKRESFNGILITNLKSLVLDSNGICIIKKLISSNQNQETKNKIYESIKKDCLEIIQSPFGNYIVQYVIDNWGSDYCRDLIIIIIDNLLSLSMQKFSSNVVEKSLDYINKEMREMMINQLFNHNKFMTFLKNKFGNFVLQKSLNYLSSEERKDLRKNLESLISPTSNKDKKKFMNFMNLISS